MPRRLHHQINRDDRRARLRRRNRQTQNDPASDITASPAQCFSEFHDLPAAVRLLAEYSAAVKPQSRKRRKPSGGGTEPGSRRNVVGPPLPQLSRTLPRQATCGVLNARLRRCRFAGINFARRMRLLNDFRLPRFSQSLIGKLGKSRAWSVFLRSVSQRLVKSSYLLFSRPKTATARLARNRMVSYRLHKLTGVFSDLWLLAKKELSYLQRLFASAEASTRLETDTEDRLAQEYGKARYHVYTGDDERNLRNEAAYVPISEFDVDTSPSTYLSRTVTVETDSNATGCTGGANAETDAVPVPEQGVCSDRQVRTSEKNVRASSETLYRHCDAQCLIPAHWATRLHLFLSGLFGRTPVSVVRALMAWEDCRTCRLGRCPEDASSCTDIINTLRNVAPHFCGVRTIIRRLYSIREKVSGLLEIDESMCLGSYELFMAVYRKRCVTSSDPSFSTSFQRRSLTADDIDRTYARQIENFTKTLRDFPVLPCAVCERLFSASDTKAYEDFYEPRLTSARRGWDAIRRDIDAAEIPWPASICSGCAESIESGTVPKFSRLNGMGVSDDQLFRDLNEVEKALIQRVRCFQDMIKLRPLRSRHTPGHYASGLRGLSFFLPLPEKTILETTKNYSLPNLENLKILVDCPPSKRQIIYRYLVDFSKVLACIVKLKETNPLYADVEVKGLVNLEHSSILEAVEDEDEPLSQELYAGRLLGDADGQPPDDAAAEQASLISIARDRSNFPGYSLKRVDYNMPNELAVDLYRMDRVTSAPLFEQEPDLDCLCYPTLFPDGKYGIAYKRRQEVKLSEYVNARMNHKSGRFRKNTSYVFFCAQQKDVKALSQGVYFVMKVGPFQGMTAQQLLSGLNIPESHIQRRLTSLLNKIPGTKEFCSSKFGDLQAMDEQLGPATFFVTLSPGESNWPELEEFLLLRNPEFAERRPSSIYLADTASVTLHFHRRFQAFLKFVILDNEGPLGIVEHYYYRVEYQVRGAPHIHMKLWIRGAPILGIDSTQTVVKFIENHITCVLPGDDDPELRDLVQSVQMHSHTSSCLRKKYSKGKVFSVCRHAFPRPVRTDTVLNGVEEVMRSRTRTRKPVKLYELCRRPNEAYINDYNSALLKIWRGNMDIQFTGESSLAINFYLSLYLTKAENGATAELYNSLEENRSPWSRLMSCGRALLRNREIGSYEAFDRCCGVSLFTPSVPIVYIPTAFRGERMRKVKSLHELEGLGDESTDVFCNNMVDTYYPSRPKDDKFENMCLTDFVCNHVVVKEKKGGPVAQSKLTPLTNGLGFVRDRAKKVIYRTNYYNIRRSDDSEKYFHSLLMLYVPWRDENSLMEGFASYRDSFLAKEAIFTRLAAADARKALLRRSIEKAKEIQKEAEETDLREETTAASDAADIREMIVVPVAADPQIVDELQRSLNPEQLEAFDAVMNVMEHEDKHCNSVCGCAEYKPLKLFISGNAGTGKSRVVDAIRSSVQLRYGTDGANDAASNIVLRLPVIVGAPTGVAAKNVQGVTAHGLLKLPVQHGKQATYKALNPESLNELKLLLRDVRVLVLDEVSMISNITLLHINLRLREIKQSDVDFGGIHVVVLGDLLQLRPVHGDFVFTRLTPQQVRANTGSLGVHDVWREFSYVELKRNMRQRNDVAFSELLNRARIGALNDGDVRALIGRKVVLGQSGTAGTVDEIGSGSTCSTNDGADFFATKVLSEKPNAICLVPLHETADQFNSRCMATLGIDTVKVTCRDAGSGRTSRRRKVARRKREKASDTGGLEEVVTIGVGARVMLRRNISQKDGLVNGSLGYVVGINYESGRSGATFVDSVDVKFDDLDVPRTIGKVRASFERPGFRTITREQLPLCVAYAITIHKAQGLSLDAVMLDIGANCFEPAMAYVGLSRCRRLENLYLLDFDARRVCCDETAVKEYNRLRRRFLPDEPLIEAYNTRGTIRTIMVAERAAAIQPAPHTLFTQPRPHVSERLPFPRLEPSDNSCYMDSLIHLLFSFDCMWQSFKLPYVPHSVLEVRLRDLYLHYKGLGYLRHPLPLSSAEVRQALGGVYADGGQECVWAALNALISRLPPRYSAYITSVKMQSLRCTVCNANQAVHSPPGWIVDPFLCIQRNATISFTELLTDRGITEEQCVRCGVRTAHFSSSNYVFPVDSKMVLVQIPLFNELGVPIAMKIRNLTPNDQQIFGSRYRLLSAIQHSGVSTSTGHYVCFVRSTDDRYAWMRVDGQSVTGRLRLPPNLKNVTMLGFERI